METLHILRNGFNTFAEKIAHREDLEVSKVKDEIITAVEGEMNPLNNSPRDWYIALYNKAEERANTLTKF